MKSPNRPNLSPAANAIPLENSNQLWEGPKVNVGTGPWGGGGQWLGLGGKATSTIIVPVVVGLERAGHLGLER